MVQDINFLPESYRRNKERIHDKLMRRGILVFAFVLIWSAHFRQQNSLTLLKEERNQVKQQSERMLSQLGNALSLRREIEHLDARANLVTALRIRVAPTRLLAEVSNSLPPFVQLTEFRTFREKRPSSTDSRRKTQKGNPKSAQPYRPAEEIDLTQFRENNQETTRFVSLTGVASDDIAVSKYLKALGNTASFDQVKLLYTDQHLDSPHSLREFSIRLRVRQPGRHVDSGLEIVGHPNIHSDLAETSRSQTKTPWLVSSTKAQPGKKVFSELVPPVASMQAESESPSPLSGRRLR